MKNLRFICAQPATNYYAWQVEVMLNNFIAMGINPNNIDIVCCKRGNNVPDNWSKLALKYPARFLFYNDTRVDRNYISSIRPNILKQHFLKFPELKDEVIFYHDCDIMFTKPVTSWITKEMIDDSNWYGSDTRSYIGHDYIISKGEDMLDKMCSLVGIDKSVIKDNEYNSIGAQYLLKGITSEFWSKVEIDSERLFTEITTLNKVKKANDSGYHELQIWCADMWAVLWNGWKMGTTTVTHSNFNFSWGTSNLKTYNRCNIFHNAGVLDDKQGLFYKASYINKTPYKDSLDIKEDTASLEYWKAIKKVGLSTVIN